MQGGYSFRYLGSKVWLLLSVISIKLEIGCNKIFIGCYKHET